MEGTDRGQAYTLEGLIAAIILVSSLLYGLQAVEIAPWAGGTNDEQASTFRTEARDVLARAAANGTLRRAVSCVDGNGRPVDGFGETPPGNATPLGSILERAFTDRGQSYNIYLAYWEEDRSRRNRTLVYPKRSDDPDPGDLEQLPGKNVAVATYRVTIFDDTKLRSTDANGRCVDTTNTGTFGNPTDETSDDPNESDDLYVSDVNENRALYNVVEVRLVVW